MNKKIVTLIIIIVIIALGLGFWFMKSNNSVSEKPKQNSSQIKDTKKVAVIYFSATGNTKKVANYIKDATDGDLIEIIPQEEYTDDDLNYGNDNSRANKEQNDTKARPEIKNDINTDNYDVIFLGYPIWWGDVPKIILTFLDNHNLNAKTIIPFCTSGSTDISGSLNTLKNYNKNITWINGKRFSSGASQNEVKNWVNSINY